VLLDSPGSRVRPGTLWGLGDSKRKLKNMRYSIEVSWDKPVSSVPVANHRRGTVLMSRMEILREIPVYKFELIGIVSMRSASFDDVKGHVHPSSSIFFRPDIFEPVRVAGLDCDGRVSGRSIPVAAVKRDTASMSLDTDAAPCLSLFAESKPLQPMTADG